jgi:hypothetical protein
VASVWIALGAKMMVTAAIVVAVCRVVERAGLLVGAMLATLPVSAGPAYVFLALEHGGPFIAAGTPASLSSIGGTAAFVTVYGALMRQRSRSLAVPAALAAWIAMVSLLRATAPGLLPAAAVDVALFGGCMRLVAGWRHAPMRAGAHASPWDIPIRAGATMLLIAAVIVAGRILGPGAAGLLALAPVVMTSLGILLPPRIGGPGAAAVMANTLPGLFGNGIALLALGLTAGHIGATLALLLALAICLAWNGTVLAIARTRAQ